MWILILSTWEGAYRLAGWKPYVFPAPSHVVDSLFNLVNVRTGFGETLGPDWPRLPAPAQRRPEPPWYRSPLFEALAVSGARLLAGFGISIALGAARGRVVRLILGEVGRLVIVGIMIGGFAAAAATRWVASFLYGLTSSDPSTLAVATATLAFVAVAAGAIPAVRAARVDPADALREE